MKNVFLFLVLIFCFNLTFSQSRILFNENFENNSNNWNCQNNEQLKSFIKKGKLTITNNEEQLNAIWYPLYIDQNENFSISSEIMQTNGYSDNEYGIIWRGDDWGNFACLLVSSSLYYKVFVVENGKEKILKDWTFGYEMYPKYFDNNLKIEKKNDSLFVSINGSTIYSSDYKYYCGDKIALVVGGKIKVKADFITASYYEDKYFPQKNMIFKTKIEQNFKFNDTSSIISPQLSNNDSIIYFSKISENYKDSAFSYNIFYSKINKLGFWQKAQVLDTTINNKNDNFPIYLFPGDSTIFFQNNYIKQKIQNLNISYKKNDVWNKSESIKIEEYYNLYSFTSFALSNDRKVLISSIETKDSYGKKDLYISFLTPKGVYSKPKNMGNIINTHDDEGTPFIGSDNKILYFYSYGHRGFGSADIFVSYRLDDSWTNWTKPQNLGRGINTEASETFYITDKNEKTAYFVSNIDGTEKIYKAKIFKK